MTGETPSTPQRYVVGSSLFLSLLVFTYTTTSMRYKVKTGTTFVPQNYHDFTKYFRTILEIYNMFYKLKNIHNFLMY